MDYIKKPKCSSCRCYFNILLKSDGLPYRICERCRTASLKSQQKLKNKVEEVEEMGEVGEVDEEYNDELMEMVDNLTIELNEKDKMIIELQKELNKQKIMEHYKKQLFNY